MNAVSRLALTAGTSAMCLMLAAPGRADAPADPEAIFRSARKAWAFTAYPRYATYTIVTKFRNGDVNVQRHYDALQDTRRDIVFARTFSHEEAANPSLPHGINVAVGSVNNQGGITANPERNVDRIGPLALSVNYDFGISLVPQKTAIVSSGHDIAFPPSLPIIGTTSTGTHDYSVRLIEMLGGGKIYHLGLQPLRDPGRLRLREMWVTAGTFITQKILTSGNFNDSPYTGVPWLIEFTQVGGAPYIIRETAQAPLDFDDVSLPNVTIAFEDLTPLSELPRYGAVGTNDSSKAVVEP